MTPEGWPKLNAILDQAVACDPKERQAFLDTACGADDELRREIEELLALEDEADSFLARPVVDLGEVLKDTVEGAVEGAVEDAAEAPRRGRRIGPYETVELLQQGGMGQVYLAARVDDFEQHVALKLLPRIATGGAALRRFHLERQIQARLEHPHIGRLLDGGTTEDGQPYFAMEYVDGEPIDAYCDHHALSVRQRLMLFGKVCAAVHFAHQQLVVHRDLKPANILVSTDGEPKLLDFGIAKLLRPKTIAEKIETESGSSPMTLFYASPEQVRDEPISTASDVYALGVLLYKLLTGQFPCGLEGCGSAEAMRRICEVEPEPPSLATRPTEKSASQVPARKFRRLLEGDIDAIVLKALRKDPRERYGSAEQLGEDLRRHLDDLPVTARRVSPFWGNATYVGGKFLRRHPWPVASVITILVAALSLTGWEWRRLERERERAESVTVFLEEIFYGATPDVSQGEALTARQILGHGRRQLEILSGDPELYATLAETLGRIHRHLGHNEEAGALMASSLEAWRRHHPAASPELARRLSNLGTVYYANGAYAEAEKLFRQALEVRQSLGQTGGELAKISSNLASTLVERGAYGEAEALYRQVLETRRRARMADSRAVASSLRQLGSMLYHQGRLDEAEAPLREALALRRAYYGDRHTRVASVLHMLGSQRLAAGDGEEAEALLQEALVVRRGLLGDDHIDVARTRRQLAAVLLAGGESPATVAVLLERALQVLYRVKPQGDWEIADAESLLGAHLASVGRLAEAEACLLRGGEILEATRGPEALLTRQARQRFITFAERINGRKRLFPSDPV